MIRAVAVSFLLCLALASPSAGAQFETDTFSTSAGDLTITFIGHGTLMIQWGEKAIHVDPLTQYADYSRLPMS